MAAMSRSARSIWVFSIYLELLGVVLLLTPNTLLSLFGLPATQEVWIRVVGMLVVLLGFYYWQAARHELTSFFHWTVLARSSVLIFFVAFVAAKLAPPILLLFGVIDLAAAAWTAHCLRSERSMSDHRRPPTGE